MLNVVIWGTVIGAGGALVFSFISLFMSRDKAEVEATVKKLNQLTTETAPKPGNQPETLAERSKAHADLTAGLSDYIKALSEFAGNLSKLKEGVAGLLIAFALFGLAGGLATIDDKVNDKKDQPAKEKPGSKPQNKPNR